MTYKVCIILADLVHLVRMDTVDTAKAPNLSPARQGALPNGSLLPGEDKFCICVARSYKH